jgi:hypothetical protein
LAERGDSQRRRGVRPWLARVHFAPSKNYPQTARRARHRKGGGAATVKATVNE